MFAQQLDEVPINRFSMVAANVVVITAGIWNKQSVGLLHGSKPRIPASTASANEISKEKQNVKNSMKDPDAVQFRGMAGYYRGEPGFTTLCGELNAKNGFGAYAGYRHFTSLAGIVVMNEMEGKEVPWENSFNSHWNETCKP